MKFVQYQVADIKMSPVVAEFIALVVFSALVMFVDYGLTESLSTEGELSSFLIVLRKFIPLRTINICYVGFENTTG